MIQGAESIDQLLAKARNFVPEKYWKNTPLALRATAGLRLLPVEKADGLLNEVLLILYYEIELKFMKIIFLFR